ncbi:hypothetical protein JD77_01964 [Micromonospora olivasterospora]|uniref:Uncharacterized protein n=1 Tax=Micromonospora olivasterospora TaxID=1880 RepID=A0A562I8J9_MICOL|nr:hypothetical protein JD77_01964 [Micromonospora olivasterospora]
MRCRRYSRRAAIISDFFGVPDALPHEVTSIASEESPNMPPTTYEYAPPPRPNIIAMATVPPSIGSTISACCQRPPVTAGISGGASTGSSPTGISGAGRRGGRLTTTVDTRPPHSAR